MSGVGIGVLTWVFAPDLVDEAVGDGLAWEMRLRELPSRLGVYFILGLCLFSHQPYGQVLRELTGGLQGALAAAGWRLPATTALTGVRRRVGDKPLESLFRRLASPLTWGRASWSHLCGLLVVAWDGTTVAAADSPANTAAFGKPGAGRRRKETGEDPAGRAAVFPQLRLVTLVACGTRALLGASFGPVRGKGTGERDLARDLLPSLGPGMLLLADRGFYSYALWTAAAGTGADLLWRATDNMQLPVARPLPDGSWLATIRDPRAVQARLHKNGKRRRRGSPLPPDTSPLPAITVRVIEFVLTITSPDTGTRSARYRLITTLLDCQSYPAAELAGGYGRRWAAETAYREFKTYLRGPGRVLRGRTPALARQELWAYLALYQAIRTIICRAAARDGTDPGQISFTAALHAARRTITTARHDMPAALDQAEAEILDPRALIPPRQARICPRAAKTRTPAYPPRRGHPSPAAHHAQHTLTITTPSPATPPTHDQHKQPPQPPDTPP